MSYAGSYHYRYHHVPLEHLCLCQTQGLPSGSPIKWLSLTIQQLRADSVRWVVVALEVLRRDDAQRGVGPLQKSLSAPNVVQTLVKHQTEWDGFIICFIIFNYFSFVSYSPKICLQFVFLFSQT